jgi:hypothetical protein
VSNSPGLAAHRINLWSPEIYDRQNHQILAGGVAGIDTAFLIQLPL